MSKLNLARPCNELSETEILYGTHGLPQPPKITPAASLAIVAIAILIAILNTLLVVIPIVSMIPVISPK